MNNQNSEHSTTLVHENHLHRIQQFAYEFIEKLMTFVLDSTQQVNNENRKNDGNPFDVRSTEKTHLRSRKIFSSNGAYFINGPNHSWKSVDRLSIDPEVFTQSKDNNIESTSRYDSKSTMPVDLDEKFFDNYVSDRDQPRKSLRDCDEHHISQSLPFSLQNQQTSTDSRLIHNQCSTYLDPADQIRLLTFVQNHINNQQWPLVEYVGFHRDQLWRAFRLAADISNFSEDFLFNYHEKIDSIDEQSNQTVSSSVILFKLICLCRHWSSMKLMLVLHHQYTEISSSNERCIIFPFWVDLLLLGWTMKTKQRKQTMFIITADRWMTRRVDHIHLKQLYLSDRNILSQCSTISFFFFLSPMSIVSHHMSSSNFKW